LDNANTVVSLRPLREHGAMSVSGVTYELSDLYGDLDDDPTQPALGQAPFFNDEAPTRELPPDIIAVLRMVSAELPEMDD
jgi:hypothetical protein